MIPCPFCQEGSLLHCDPNTGKELNPWTEFPVPILVSKNRVKEIQREWFACQYCGMITRDITYTLVKKRESD